MSVYFDLINAINSIYQGNHNRNANTQQNEFFHSENLKEIKDLINDSESRLKRIENLDLE